MKINIIVAMSENNVIGVNGKIPWKIKGEQKRFKDLTVGNTIIMGRKSFDEIGKPLPNRDTILISKSKQVEEDNCKTVETFEQAIESAEKQGVDEVYIAGGGQVYSKAISMVDKIYLTIVHKYFDGDVFFPYIDLSEFERTYIEYVEGDIPYTYLTYKRR